MTTTLGTGAEPHESPPARRRFRGALTSSLLVSIPLLAPLAASAQAVVSASPDVTIALGPGNVVTSDEAVAADNQLGIVALQGLGAIPSSADVTGYADAGGGQFYFSLDTTVSLPGGVVARPADVVSWNGASHGLVFESALHGIPSGVQVDAIGVTATNGLLLSFDTDVALPGGLTVADEDLVKFDGASFTLALDGSAAGIDRALDVDGAQDVGGGYLVSFDTAGTVGGVTFQDEDILRVVGGSWTMAFDASSADADWSAADLDALQVPEPGAIASAALGAIGLAGLARRRRR
ncbi:MAG: PEP-CTERM sorting domain-containing protein [Myxococcota bacterium]